MEIKEYKVIKEFSIAYVGWEYDSKGWIVENEVGQKSLVLTDHGILGWANKKELNDIINMYKLLIEDTKEALELLK